MWLCVAVCGWRWTEIEIEIEEMVVEDRDRIAMARDDGCVVIWWVMMVDGGR